MKVSIKAPAKINLSLDILGKRPDNFHEVHMVMTTIDLADRIQLESIPENKIIIQSHNRFVPSDKRNLAYQAAALLKRRFGIQTGVIITIDKIIPVAAGLAGGSSNAAATLRGLNKLWHLGLTLDELAVLGSEIGSDVAFCVYGGTAIATGRGEKIEQIPTPPPCWVVLAKLPMGVSTADVYNSVNLATLKRPDVDKMVTAIKEKDYQKMCASLGNALESITFAMHPDVRNVKEKMLAFGADAALMSGSGPTVFALVKHDSRMHRVYNGLKGFCNQVFAVRLLGMPETID